MIWRLLFVVAALALLAGLALHRRSRSLPELAGFVRVAARERTLGSPWIAPLGVLGPIAWGVAPILALHVRADFAILFSAA